MIIELSQILKKRKEFEMKKFNIKCKECGALYWCPNCGSTWFVESQTGFTLCRSCWQTISAGLNCHHKFEKHKKYKCKVCGKKYRKYIDLEDHKYRDHAFWEL